jgi:hypothetical protein
MRSTILKALFTLSSFTLSSIALTLTPKPAIAAEKIYFNHGSFQFPISIASLQDFAQDGTENPDIRFLTSKLTPEQQTEARKMLKFRLSPQQYDQLREAMSLSDQKSYVYLSRFLNSPTPAKSPPTDPNHTAIVPSSPSRLNSVSIVNRLLPSEF